MKFTEIQKFLKEDASPKAKKQQILKWMLQNAEEFKVNNHWDVAEAAKAAAKHFGDEISHEPTQDLYYEVSEDVKDMLQIDLKEDVGLGYKGKVKPIPKDWEVQPLKPGQPAKDRATCGHCGLSWDDGISTSMTPTPSGRCPFEYFHIYPKDKKKKAAIKEDAEYKSQAARDAKAGGYGNKTYWDYLDQHAQELHDKFMKKGDEKTAKEMLTRSLSDALKGNEGN